MAGWSGTSSRIRSAELLTASTPGKARASSSAVRAAPGNVVDNSEVWQCGQLQRAGAKPQRAHSGRSRLRARIGPEHLGQRAALRQREQRSEAECPTRGTWTSTGPRARWSRRKRKATDGILRRAAVGSRSLSSSPTARTGADTRRASSGRRLMSPSHPRSRSACASVERPWPASSSAADSCAARSTATVLLCGCGVRGSAWASLPSSTTTISPRFRSGANDAPRVPSTIRAWPRLAAR